MYLQIADFDFTYCFSDSKELNEVVKVKFWADIFSLARLTKTVSRS